MDGTIAEIFWQQGRVAQTVPIQTWLTPVAPPDAAVAVVSDGLSGVVVLNATVHAMASAWVSVEAVLRHTKPAQDADSRLEIDDLPASPSRLVSPPRPTPFRSLLLIFFFSVLIIVG